MMRQSFLYIFLAWLTLLALFPAPVCSQVVTPKKDSVFFLANKKGLLGKLGKAVSVNLPETVIKDTGAIKNEAVFNPFKGKLIRQIRVERIGFNTQVNDTLIKNKRFLNDISDALHSGTTSKAILRNLFFGIGDSLYPALLADNERFLRDLSYLQDARIVVNTTRFDTSAVEVTILWKDLFPIGGSVQVGSTKSASLEVNDDNLFGQGDRIQVHNLYDRDRNPSYGFGIEYLKRNIGGSFLNLAIGYQNQAPAFNTGRREERALYLRGELPLVSPYHIWTGAFETAIHYTQNGYVSDSLYRTDAKYRYEVLDGWLGYNVGARKQLRQNFTSRLKQFIALRGVHRKFTDIPELFENDYNIQYSTLQGVLSSFTIFEQDYYRTNFLYGFGRNEDVPEGFSLSLTGGWIERNQVSRPYLGFDYQRNYFSDTKNYLNYIIRFGTYFNKNHFEDISFLTSLEYFTRLRKLYGNWFVRHFLSGSITQQVKTVLNEPLRLSSIYGIPMLDNNNIEAATRLSVNGESVFYNTWKFFGFSFAPFAFANVSYLKSIGGNVFKGDVFTAVGSGIRTRNENLIFGTIELKAYYFPRSGISTNPWNVTFNTNLRFKYNSQFIKRPDLAAVN